MIWPEPKECPIHRNGPPKPEIGGCDCYEVKVANEMLAACKSAFEKQGKLDEADMQLLRIMQFQYEKQNSYSQAEVLKKAINILGAPEGTK